MCILFAYGNIANSMFHLAVKARMLHKLILYENGCFAIKIMLSRNMSNLMILAKMHVIIGMNDECSAYATNVND